MRTADELDDLLAGMAEARLQFDSAIERGVWSVPPMQEFMRRVIELVVDYTERVKFAAPHGVTILQPMVAFPPGVTVGPALEAAQDALEAHARRFPLAPVAVDESEDGFPWQCSFCHKPQREVAKLVASSTGSVICDECLAQAVELMSKHAKGGK